ncbi:MAG: methyltransferase domain-containing protein [Dehalococcoidia bacterium]|nr:methyltransferase domain-containing protein [Dehalococcoidia bacterium]
MNPTILQYIVCPDCTGSLAIAEGAIRNGDEVMTAQLTCSQCARQYPVVRGIPRLMPGYVADDKLATASAFGWEWQEFDALHDQAEVYQDQYLDWIHPIDRSFFQHKVVLDAGCGMGRFSIAAAEFGARDVLAIDLSDAVESAYRNSRHLPNVHVIQADIYHLPFKQPFDFAFSIGVLHHLPDPKGGFRSLVKHLKRGGSIFAWVYGRENNGWIVHLANPLRERVFSRLPRKVLYGVSLAITGVLHPILKALYRPGGAWRKMLPYYSYLSWLGQFGFRHNHHVIFDHLVAPTAFYLRREEFALWFSEAKLPPPRLSWRNENSWRGFATLEHADSRA